MKTENILIIVLTVIAGFGLLWSGYSFYGAKESNNITAIENTQENYNKALESELTDKCATPEGYTDESWAEHMSHHPDRYEECL